MRYLRTSPKPRRQERREGEKRCRYCGIWKPTDAFYPHKATADGLDSWCKACKRDSMDRYHDEAAPPRSSEELFVDGNLSASEKMLVNRMVVAMREGEAEHRHRLRHRPPPGFRRGLAEESKCERILRGIPWRRQVTLMSCAIALAKEQGVEFAYHKLRAVNV